MNNKVNRAGTGLVYALLAIFILSVCALAYSGWEYWRGTRYDNDYRQISSDLRVLAQKVATSSRQATFGDAAAFDELESSANEFTARLGVLNHGTNELPSPRNMLGDELGVVTSNWTEVRGAADTIVASKERFLFIHEIAGKLDNSIPELQRESNNVVDILLTGKSPASQVAAAQRQSWLAERIARNVDRMLEGGEAANQAADQFSLDASLFGGVLDGMLNKNAALRIDRVADRNARASLQKIATAFDFVRGSIDEIFNASPDLLEVRRAADAIIVGAPAVTDSILVLDDGIDGLAGRRTVTPLWATVSATIAVLSLLGIAALIIRRTRQNLRTTSATNEQNQKAILRLLDEIGDLADGDLTTNATVTQDFTGAIADSINYAIAQLRGLVSSINDAAVSVSSSVEENQQVALSLADSSVRQAQEISVASQAVNEMARSIDEVSANAAESAAVAERSVDIASSGGQVVRNTITGMDNIREQIQDTSKRLKRLGESSQEIGDIVSLINDISDQTNILALNAAIQASMAGDAGRGFAVVADEVQRLAERSGAAAKQIEALVKTIQSDTNGAVISMEQTTAEVVRGAKLAQDAGVALEEIENVSTDLASLIQNISNASKQQSTTASNIANTMGVVRDIASRTSAGSKVGAASIGELASLAGGMRKSIEGFKLPKEPLDGELVEHDVVAGSGPGAELSEYMPDYATVSALGSAKAEGSIEVQGGSKAPELAGSPIDDAADKARSKSGNNKVEPVA